MVARLAQIWRMPIHAVEESLSVDDFLDEIDAMNWLYDVDNEPDW